MEPVKGLEPPALMITGLVQMISGVWLAVDGPMFLYFSNDESHPAFASLLRSFNGYTISTAGIMHLLDRLSSGSYDINDKSTGVGSAELSGGHEGRSTSLTRRSAVQKWSLASVH
jgi:hypothetical protein